MAHFDRTDEAYTATAVDGGHDWRQGEIRVEPPFIASQEWLDARGEEGDVELQHIVTSEKATILRFSLHGANHHLSPEIRVETAVTGIIGELGGIASRKNFLRLWAEE